MAVIAGGIPDRVPTDLHDSAMATGAAGVSYGRCLDDGERLAEAQLISWRCFKHDMVVVEGGGTAMARAMGCEVACGESGLPRVVAPVLNDLRDAEKLCVPDPEKDAALRELLRAVGVLRRELGDRVFILGSADLAPLALAAALCGHERFLVDLGGDGDPAQIERVLDVCLDAAVRLARALQRAGAHGTSIFELGPEAVSPGLYHRFALPRLRRFFGAMRAEGFPAALHQCGTTVGVLPGVAASGAGMLDLDCRGDLRGVKNAARGRAVVLGMVDPATVMHRGTDALVEARCREALEILAPGGGFILGPGAALLPDTPPENVVMLVETARRYGRYRPDGKLAV